MNIAHDLYDEGFVKELFARELVKVYPRLPAIKEIKISGVKTNIWETTYHVVIKYDLIFAPNAEMDKLPIYVSAHSNEPRENVYSALKFLWANGFGDSSLTVPHPLFYLADYRAIFYRGCEGDNLYRVLKHFPNKMAKETIARTAAWFAKLHQLSVGEAQNFNPLSSHISGVIPGREHILSRVQAGYPQYHEVCAQIYQRLEAAENSYLAKTKARQLIHGDAHPENVIRLSAHHLALIDFTDMCLGDFARDLGSFVQQLDYMLANRIAKPQLAVKYKKLFLKTYCQERGIRLGKKLRARIDVYYQFTALRTAIMYLLQHQPEIDKAEILLQEIKRDLAL